MVLIAAGIAFAGNYEISKKSGDLTVLASIDKNPPVVGDNNISITVKDSSGRAVTDAKVKLEYSMPAMPGMPPMNYKANASLIGNAYQAKMNLSMAGPWSIAIKTTRRGKTSTVKFSVDAH